MVHVRKNAIPCELLMRNYNAATKFTKRECGLRLYVYMCIKVFLHVHVRVSTNMPVQ